LKRLSIGGESAAGQDILVVEEDAPLRDLVAMKLKQCGLTPWPAGSGREALELFQQHGDAIAVALLDVGMSGVDGPQTLTTLRGLRPDLTCCFMTGGGGRYTEAELLRMGAARVFAKPFSLDEVARALKRLAVSSEQRKFPRRAEKQFKVSVADVPACAPAREGWLRDCSSGGIGVFLPAAVTVGSLLYVHPAAEREAGPGVEVLVKHCHCRDDGWFVGGQFMGGALSAMPLFGV
jgi:CheY-like chemotaxis protein